VPPTKKVDEMFDYFQDHNTRVAIILGEYGEVLGIVTMKDVLTFIFGEISGKMVGHEYYQEEDENSYIVPGDMRLTDFNNLTNFDIEDPVMATIGGVAFRLYDRLPLLEDKVTYEGYEFTVKELKGLRISMIQVQKRSTNKKTELDAEQLAEELKQKTDSIEPKSESDNTHKRKKKKKKKPAEKQPTEKQTTEKQTTEQQPTEERQPEKQQPEKQEDEHGLAD